MKSSRSLRLHVFGLTVVGAMAVASCSPRQTGDKVVTINGVTYYFPGRELDGFLAPEETGDGQVYVRLMPPPGYMMLTYNPSDTSRPNEQGPKVPTIDHVNFVPGTNIKVIQTKAGPVVCKADEKEFSHTCGLRVIDEGLVWSVKFDWDLVESAEAIKTRAEATLRQYRTDWRLKRS